MPDLSVFGDREGLKAAVHKYQPAGVEQALHTHTGELWAIANDVSVGDIIVMPRRHNYSIAIGRVKHPYRYLSDVVNPQQRHVVSVDWAHPAFSRTPFSKAMNDALNVPLTIYRPRPEIAALLQDIFESAPERNGDRPNTFSEDARKKRADSIAAEMSRRAELEKALGAGNGRWLVAASRLREIGLYGGSSGIYFDATRTRLVRQSGVTVSLLHNAHSYADELTESRMNYRYPKTNRPPRRDMNEILATKAACELEFPIYVISNASGLRDVRRGWVTGWSDEDEVFFVEFGDTSQMSVIHTDDTIDNLGLSDDFSFDGAPDREVRGRARREQRFARALLLGKREDGKCRLCGRVFAATFLVAAHKKRRSECSLEEKLDLRNIVMLCCVFGCDALYEHGYVTVSGDGVLDVSDRCGPVERGYAQNVMLDRIAVAENESQYFAWHFERHCRTE